MKKISDKNQSISNFIFHVTGKCHHFLRLNNLKMCYFYVYLHICETQVHSCTGSAIVGIPHVKLFVTDTSFHFFQLNTYSLSSYYFAAEPSPSRC